MIISAPKRKIQEWRRTSTGPESITAVKDSVLQFPHRSARKHAVASRLLDQLVKKSCIKIWYCIFNKKTQQPKYQVNHWHRWRKFFLDMSIFSVAILGGQYISQIWQSVSFVSRAVPSTRCTNSTLRTLQALKEIITGEVETMTRREMNDYRFQLN